MKEKAQLIVMSHLSDAQQLATMGSKFSTKQSVQEINFAKFIIMQTNGDLTIEIDPDQMWEKFLER
jgi:hypothetical protein